MRFVEILESNNMVIKEGDTKDVFKLGLSYSNGSKPDLTDATVNIFIANESGVVVTKPMTIIDDGVVSFELTDEDITGTGSLDAEMIIIYPDGKRETFPDTNYVSFKVVPSIEKRGEYTFVDHYEVIITRVEQLKRELEEIVEQAKVDIGSGSHNHNLDDLNNVQINNAVSGQILKYDGDKWINSIGGASTEDLDLSDYATKEELSQSLINKADTIHTHDNYITDIELDEAIANAKLEGESVDLSNYATKTELANKSDISHKHETSDITDLEGKLSGKSDISHKHETSDITDLEDRLSGKADYAHTHSQYVTETEMNNAIADAQLGGDGEVDLSGKADVDHKHITEDITTITTDDDVNALWDVSADLGADLDLEVDLTKYVTKSELENKLTTSEYIDIIWNNS